MEIGQKFKEWARSLSGCDGGNPAAKIWICGIEWGYSKKDAMKPKEYYEKELPQQIASGQYKPSNTYNWKESLKSRYGISIAKLYFSIMEEKVEDYKELIEKCDGKEIFKMNLYPIAFNNTDDRLWKEYKLDKLTGFEEKYLFKTWCFLHRFPFFSDMVKEENPKLIIGTGVSYLTDFFVCFGGKDSIDATINVDIIEPESPSDKKRTYYWGRLKNGTIIVVIPFFSGPYGFNSDDLIQKMGDKIRKLLDQQSSQCSGGNTAS